MYCIVLSVSAACVFAVYIHKIHKAEEVGQCRSGCAARCEGHRRNEDRSARISCTTVIAIIMSMNIPTMKILGGQCGERTIENRVAEWQAADIFYISDWSGLKVFIPHIETRRVVSTEG